MLEMGVRGNPENSPVELQFCHVGKRTACPSYPKRISLALGKLPGGFMCHDASTQCHPLWKEVTRGTTVLPVLSVSQQDLSSWLFTGQVFALCHTEG
jgi:hypothetical protein